MSASYNIYARPIDGVTDDDLICDTNQILDGSFELSMEQHPRRSDYYREYIMYTYPGPLGLTVHDDYGDPIDIPFGKYRYDLDIDTPGGPPGESDGNAWRLTLMRKLYDGLVATGRYDCMLVYDFYKVMATNAPLVTDPREYPED